MKSDSFVDRDGNTLMTTAICQGSPELSKSHVGCESEVGKKNNDDGSGQKNSDCFITC